MFTLKGKLHHKADIAQVSATFRKREFVIEFADNPMYPQYIKFQLVQEKCELVDAFETGTEVEVSFNLRGRIWNNPQGEQVFFNSLDAWRIMRPQAEPVNQGGATPEVPNTGDVAAPAVESVDVTKMEEDDDLPF